MGRCVNSQKLFAFMVKIDLRHAIDWIIIKIITHADRARS